MSFNSSRIFIHKVSVCCLLPFFVTSKIDGNGIEIGFSTKKSFFATSQNFKFWANAIFGTEFSCRSNRFCFWSSSKNSKESDEDEWFMLFFLCRMCDGMYGRLYVVSVRTNRPSAPISATIKPFIMSKRDHPDWTSEQRRRPQQQQHYQTVVSSVVVIYLFASFQVSSGKSYFPHNMLKWWYRLHTTAAAALASPCASIHSCSTSFSSLALALARFCSRSRCICIFSHGSMCQLLSYHSICNGLREDRETGEKKTHWIYLKIELYPFAPFRFSRSVLMQASFPSYFTNEKKNESEKRRR